MKFVLINVSLEMLTCSIFKRPNNTERKEQIIQIFPTIVCGNDSDKAAGRKRANPGKIKTRAIDMSLLVFILLIYNLATASLD